MRANSHGDALVRYPGLQARHRAVAIIDPTAHLEDDVIIDPLAVIGPNVEIGAGTVVGAGAVIGVNVRIGRDCNVGAAPPFNAR